MGNATILGFSPNLAAMISSGGRISTMEGTAGQIWQKSLELGEEKNERLIGKVVSSGHTSVLEHGYVNLSFENVSVFAEQFLIEFRLASFTVKSRRYVDFSNCGWVTPFADAARAALAALLPNTFLQALVWHTLTVPEAELLPEVNQNEDL